MKRTFVLFLMAVPSLALGGGFETPDNGTEALGRGGAFVAKADDGTALEYNIAGLAGQDGTRVTIDANLVFHDIAFTRDGVYSGDPGNAKTPYAGRPYPTTHDKEGFFPAPFLGVSTKFGWFKRWTFGFGVYGPSSAGKHNYDVGDGTMKSAAFDTQGKPYMADNPPPATITLADGSMAPGPARYDVATVNLLIVFPTLAVAVRPVRWLDVGVAGQLVYANFKLSAANYTPLGLSSCPTVDYAGCDAYAQVSTTGTAFAGLFSLLAHPTGWLDLGATLRTPVDVSTTGTIHAVGPPGMKALPDYDATFTSHLPLWVRGGGRVIARRADGSERADLELDLTYENWSSEVSDKLTVPLFPFSRGGDGLNADITHNYRDTFGLRMGGAYNHRVDDKLELIGRAGVYFDSAATHYKDTRLDFNTYAKYALTVGGGVRYKGLLLNVAYAFIYSPTRVVDNSDILALNGVNGNPTGNDARIVVGNGKYEPSTQILSVGLTINTARF